MARIPPVEAAVQPHDGSGVKTDIQLDNHRGQTRLRPRSLDRHTETWIASYRSSYMVLGTLE